MTGSQSISWNQATLDNEPLPHAMSWLNSCRHRFRRAWHAFTSGEDTLSPQAPIRSDRSSESVRLESQDEEKILELMRTIQELSDELNLVRQREAKQSEHQSTTIQDGQRYAGRIIRSLRAARKKTEDAALLIGTHVSDLYNIGRNDNAIATAALAGMLGDSTGDRQVALADIVGAQKRSVAKFLHDSQAFFDRQYQAATDARDSCQAMTECVAKVNQLVFSSELLAFNVRVEAIRLGDSGSTFAVLADEMVKFSQAIKNTNLAIQKSLGAVSHRMSVYHNESSAMKDELAEFAGQLSEQMEAVQSRTEELTHSLESTLQRMTVSNGRLMASSQEALSALQFQDPLAQDLMRTEHEVQKIRSLLETGTSDDTNLAEIDPAVGNDGTLDREPGVVELF